MSTLEEMEELTHNQFSDSDSDDEDEVDEFQVPSPAPLVAISGEKSVDRGLSADRQNNEKIAAINFDSSDSDVIFDLREASVKSADIIAECYEWMWHLGFKGLDPLCLAPDDIPELSAQLPRTDVAYSSAWMSNHITTLEQTLVEVKYLIATCSEEVLSGHSFRASKLKKEIEFQAMPVNLHIQLLNVQRCPALDGKARSDVSQSMRVIDSITCGAMSPHALGHKAGGLSLMETNLQRSKSSLEALKKQYEHSIREIGRAHV